MFVYRHRIKLVVINKLDLYIFVWFAILFVPLIIFLGNIN